MCSNGERALLCGKLLDILTFFGHNTFRKLVCIHMEGTYSMFM